MTINDAIIGGVTHGDGYLLVGADGGVFNFSSEPFLGSLGAGPRETDVVTVMSAAR